MKRKMVDTFSTPDALKSCWNEVESYKNLESLQGSTIPTFYGFFNLNGFLVLALDDCRTQVTEAEVAQHKDAIDKAVSLIQFDGVVHSVEMVFIQIFSFMTVNYELLIFMTSSLRSENIEHV